MTSNPKDAGDLLVQGPDAHHRILEAIGKSQSMPVTAALATARPITRRMEDCDARPWSGYGLTITSEDDVGSVTRPRFEDMGGDVQRAMVLEAIGVGAKEYLFNLSGDGLSVLEQLLAAWRS